MRFLPMNTGWMTSILGMSDLELLRTPVAASLSLSLGHNPRSGAHFSFGEAQAVIWMARLRNAPRGVRPDVGAKQLKYAS